MAEEQIEQAFEQALNLRNSGKLEEALDTFRAIEAGGSRHPAILMFLGATLWELERLAEAEPYAQETVRLSPKSELASKCLFHILWDSGETAAAVDEIHRFLSVSESPDYEDILNEISEKEIELV